MNGKFAKIADGLHIDLRLFDFETGLFLNSIGHILRGNGAIQLASFTSLGGKDQSQSIDLVGEILQLRILFCAADLSLGTDLFGLFEAPGVARTAIFCGSRKLRP